MIGVVADVERSGESSRGVLRRWGESAWIWPSLVVLLVLSFVVGTALGAEQASWLVALSDPASVDAAIIFGVRGPRVALAAITGAGLASVGVAFQALLRNPLAEPYIMGVSGGAALGATVVTALGVGAVGWIASAVVPAAAMVGGLVATLLVYGISRADRGDSPVTILLVGVMFNAMASAIITFIKTLVSAAKAQELLFWLVGFIDVPSKIQLLVLTVYVVIGIVLLWTDSGRMNLLALGDESARHLGVDVARMKRRVYLVASLIVGAVVSVTGLIGFVGLIVPHGMRKLMGPDHRRLIPAAALAGASVLASCDMLSRVLFQWLGTEPPVGAVTALIGGALFLWILRSGGVWSD